MAKKVPQDELCAAYNAALERKRAAFFGVLDDDETPAFLENNRIKTTSRYGSSEAHGRDEIVTRTDALNAQAADQEVKAQAAAVALVSLLENRGPRGKHKTPHPQILLDLSAGRGRWIWLCKETPYSQRVERLALGSVDDLPTFDHAVAAIPARRAQFAVQNKARAEAYDKHVLEQSRQQAITNGYKDAQRARLVLARTLPQPLYEVFREAAGSHASMTRMEFLDWQGSAADVVVDFAMTDKHFANCPLCGRQPELFMEQEQRGYTADGLMWHVSGSRSNVASCVVFKEMAAWVESARLYGFDMYGSLTEGF